VTVKAVLSALQFRKVLPHTERTLEISLPDNSTVKYVVQKLSEKVGIDIEELLKSKKVVIILKNRVLQYEEEADHKLSEGESLIFINPLIGG